ncbi:MAG: class I SAM-dependent methyltransferase [Solirubrobacteraceae bacterium]
MTKPTDTVHHPIFARLYERISATADRRGADEHRTELLAGLTGRVIEVGAGNGRNFAHYPSTVTEVLAVEPEPRLRESALRAAADVSVPVRVIDGVADHLSADDGSADAGVASLVLCTVPDQDAALAELRRVIRPGGELRFYEHVVSRRSGAARLERALDATIYPHLSGGCHLARDTLAAIERAGFEIRSSRRFAFGPSALGPQVAHVLGTAHRP